MATSKRSRIPSFLNWRNGLRIFGLSGVAYEALGQASPRWLLLLVYAQMLGITIPIHLDEKGRQMLERVVEHPDPGDDSPN